MATYWQFREILDIYPERKAYFQCAATSKVGGKRGGQRCLISGQWIGYSDLEAAENILNIMDRTPKLDDCRPYLKDLAGLTICKSPHRKNVSFQNDCCKRWSDVITAYEEREKLNMQNTESTLALPTRAKVTSSIHPE